MSFICCLFPLREYYHHTWTNLVNTPCRRSEHLLIFFHYGWSFKFIFNSRASIFPWANLYRIPKVIPEATCPPKVFRNPSKDKHYEHFLPFCAGNLKINSKHLGISFKLFHSFLLTSFFSFYHLYYELEILNTQHQHFC